MLTPGELTRDPRARRAAVAANAAGYEVVGVCGIRGGEEPVPLGGVDLVRVGSQRRRTSTRPAFGAAAPRGARGLVREARGLGRLLRLVWLTARLAATGSRLRPFDVVHAHDVETLPAAWLVRRPGNGRLVYDAHELYGDQEPDSPRLYRAVVRRLERSLARHADAVVTVSDPIAVELQRLLDLRLLPAVVLNCPPKTDLDITTHSGGPLRAVYQGAAGPGRRLDDLLDAAAGADGVHLTIRVVNTDLEALRRRVSQRGLDERIDVAEPVPPDRLVERLGTFDVGLVINRPVTRNDELVFPNKLFEYLMAGLAVVVPRLPGLASFVERERVGLTYEPGRPAALGAALGQLAADVPLLDELRRRARRIALERYNAESEAQTLERVWGG